VQWRSLGRSLRAFAMRVRRGSPLYNNKKIQDRGMPRLLRAVLQSKSMGAGVVRARPPHNYAWRRQNLVPEKFSAPTNKNRYF
jgi:hypothetical protein